MWRVHSVLVSVPDPKPTPARIAFSITHRDTGSDIRTGCGLGMRLIRCMNEGNSMCKWGGDGRVR